jgi:hypothetical protein
MKLIKIVLFCLVSNLSFGQYYLYLTNASNSNTCDGTAYYSYPYPTNYAGYSTWKKIIGNDTIIIQEGGVIKSNLCPGNYIYESMDLTCEYPAVTKFSIKANSDLPCEDFSISTVTFEPHDSDFNPKKIVSEVNNGTPPYTFYYDNSITESEYPTCCTYRYTTDTGIHSIKIVDSIGCTDSLTIELKEINICRSYLSLGYFSTQETITNACDGSIELIPQNTNEPTIYQNDSTMVWDDGSIGYILSDLCPGIHLGNITVESILYGICTSRFFIKIDDALDSVFVSGDYINNYSTLHSEWIDECSIDLTAIQSVEIIDFNFITPDSIVVTWEVRDTNQVVATIYAGYSIPNTSENYNFVLQLYCLQKSFPVYAHAVDQYYIGELSVSTSTLEGVSIAPNPVESILKVKSEVDFDTYLISDLSGKIVKSQDYTSEINIEDLQSGIYILHLHQDENVVLVKFVKK